MRGGRNAVRFRNIKLTHFFMDVKLFKIEKEIKVPAIEQSHEPTMPSAVALTLVNLTKGDSFLVKGELEEMKASKVVYSANKRERVRKSGKEFLTRRVKNGLRIWRVK